MSATTWTIAGGTARGDSHRLTDAPCQDAVAWWSESGGLVAALADGAGSAAAAELGARAAVEAVITGYRRAMRRPRPPVDAERLARVLLRYARGSVRQAAADAGRPIRDLACTLAVVVGTADQVCSAQIGDGVVVVRTPGNVLSDGAPALRGEYANEAVFLTQGETVPDCAVVVTPAAGLTAFALSSDGLRLVITERGGRPYEPFFADVFDQVAAGAGDEDVTTFLEKVDDRTGDDKSLILAVRGRES